MLIRHKNLSFLFLLSFVILLNIISNSSLLINQYKLAPQYLKNKTGNIINQDKILGIGAYRWSNIDSQTIITYSSKIYYNKASLILTEFWDFADFFSPRFYFLSGDGTPLTPTNTEPLLTILFPFWVFGIVSLLTKNSCKIFMLIFLNCFVAYLLGQKNLIFLWPTLLAYAYISIIGIKNIKNKLAKNTSIILIFGYWLFIMLRIINLK